MVRRGGTAERWRSGGRWVIRLKRIYNFFMFHAYFYTICLVFHYTSWHFYAFSGTNLLTRCHSASFLFSAIFVFQKSYTGNILEIGRNKSRTSRNLPKLPEVRRGDGEGPWAGHTVGRCVGRRGPAPGRAPYVCDRPGPPLTLPLRLKTPRREKPKDRINFLETHRDPPPSSTRDWEGPEALPGTLPERGITTGGLLRRHACLRCDE
jgi:hypothetical protein